MTFILSAISLCYMLLAVLYHAVRYCRAGRAQKYAQLKSFRKGTFGLIYLGAIPLYLAGNLFNGLNAFRALFDSFSNALALMALSFKWSVVLPLTEINPFYKVAVYLCFAAAICNTTMFTFSLLARRIRNRMLLGRIKKGERHLCILVGFNDRTRALIASVDRRDYDLLLLAPITDSVKELAFIHDFAVLPFSPNGTIGPILQEYACHTDKRTVRMIINTENEEQNFLLATAVGAFTVQLGWKHFSLDGSCGFSAYVFGSDGSESSFVRLSEKTHGCVQCINRYNMLALDFVAKHPITECLHQNDIDRDTLTVREDITLNFVMIGFGHVNRQLLRVHSVNSQLLGMRNGHPHPKTVNYHVYDIKESEKDKNLNHSLLRYARWYKQVPREEIYPVPQDVFAIGYRHMDIADPTFYDALYRDLTNVHSPLDPDRDAPATAAQLSGLRNSILISCDSDLVNIDFAQKLLEKLNEWGLQDRTKIYVRVRSDEIRRRIIESNYTAGEILAFGSESEACSSVSAIFAEGMDAMAKRQHLNYTRTDYPQLDEDQVQEKAITTWYDSWTQVQRVSNVYACLSARIKLNLLGLDIAPLDDPRPDACALYRERYFQGAEQDAASMRVYTREELADYRVRRHMLTRLEHQRWNAYMISNGYIPAMPEEYLSMDKQALHRVRKHANIVTFEELIHQREVLAAQRGCSYEQTDVIRYDYRLADNLPLLLSQNKQKIVTCDQQKGPELLWT